MPRKAIDCVVFLFSANKEVPIVDYQEHDLASFFG
jgi:hypothetical protein